MNRTAFRPALLTLLLALPAHAQDAGLDAAPGAVRETASSTVLTLDDARREALAHNPDLASGYQDISLAQASLAQARADYLPSIEGSVTAAGTDNWGRRDGAPAGALDTRLAAGGLPASNVFDRAAAGITVNQTLTDFGRTGNRVESARASLGAERERYEDRRQQLLLDVTSDYFRAREAQAALQVARKALNDRSLLLDQVTLLQKNKLKSELDVGFAGVSVDQARLLMLREQNAVDDALAQLCSDVGRPATDTLRLSDDRVSEQPPPAQLEPLLEQARRGRPQLLSLQARLDAARAEARAQGELGNPSLTLVGAAGAVPYGDDRLPRNYAAGAVNLSIPIFEGGRLRAAAAAANAKAEQAAQALGAAQLALTRDVRTAWLGASSTFQSIEVSRRMRGNAEQALELASSRYHLGLSSIVELNRAQLNEMDAEIAYVKALYEYQISAALLDYQLGAIGGA